MQEPETTQNGDFSIRTYGNGTPVSMCVGGLASAPSDFDGFAREMEGTTHVVDNPIHAGKVKRTSQWQSWLRAEYARMFRELDSEYLIGHSCGSYDSIAIAGELPKLRGIVMVAPPSAASVAVSGRGRLERFGLLDLCLADLCGDMPLELYESMLEAHRREYDHRIKDIYKYELPRNTPESHRQIFEVMRQCRVPIEIILGTRDIWNGTLNIEGAPHITKDEIDAAHFPHIVQPVEVAATVRKWIADISLMAQRGTVQTASEDSRSHTVSA